MIQACRGLGFSAKTGHCVSQTDVCRKDHFQRNNSIRNALSGTIHNPHSTARNLRQYLIVRDGSTNRARRLIVLF
jgi:hypothetical protein